MGTVVVCDNGNISSAVLYDTSQSQQRNESGLQVLYREVFTTPPNLFSIAWKAYKPGVYWKSYKEASCNQSTKDENMTR